MMKDYKTKKTGKKAKEKAINNVSYSTNTGDAYVTCNCGAVVNSNRIRRCTKCGQLHCPRCTPMENKECQSCKSPLK